MPPPLFLLLPLLLPASSLPVEIDYPDVDPKYTYGYSVADDYSKANYEAREERDGYKTLGSYRVALPDSRIQIVTYTANEDGFVAEVTYEGEAVYPEEAGYTSAASLRGNSVYGAQPSAYSAQPSAYSAQPSAYSAQPAQYKSEHKPPAAPYRRRTTSSFKKPAPYKSAPKPYKPAPAPYRSAPAPYQPAPDVPAKVVEEAAPAPYEHAQEVHKVEQIVYQPSDDPYNPAPSPYKAATALHKAESAPASPVLPAPYHPHPRTQPYQASPPLEPELRTEGGGIELVEPVEPEKLVKTDQKDSKLEKLVKKAEKLEKAYEKVAKLEKIAKLEKVTKQEKVAKQEKLVKLKVKPTPVGKKEFEVDTNKEEEMEDKVVEEDSTKEVILGPEITAEIEK